MDTKIIGIILLICSALLINYGAGDLIEAYLSPGHKLKTIIQKDVLTSLQLKDKEEPTKIHHVELKYRSKKAHEFLQQNQPSFETHNNGTVWLEIEILDLPDPHNPGLITQTSVFDLKSNNKISEFGQTYYFKDFDKEKIKTIK